MLSFEINLRSAARSSTCQFAERLAQMRQGIDSNSKSIRVKTQNLSEIEELSSLAHSLLNAKSSQLYFAKFHLK